MTPSHWVGHARELAHGHPTLGRTAQRSAALLARHALEGAVSDWLRREHRVAPGANFTVLLISLQHLFPDPVLAQRVAWTWSALSQACHHHGYELPPPLSDLLTWLDTVETFVVATR